MLTVNGGRTIAERATGTSSLAMSQVQRTTINLTLEFLNKCEFHCSGCYVNRRNSYTADDLDNVLSLTKQLSNMPAIEMNEVVVGPTDFFATENVEALFQEPKFLELFDHFSAITITSTLLSPPREVAELLSKTLDILPKHIHLELFVSLDVERFVGRDLIYISTLESNLKLLERANVLFIFNMHKHPLFEQYVDVARRINKDYNSHLKMNPSFFRAKKSELIKRELADWKRLLQIAVEKSSLSEVLLNVADPYFGGNTYLTLSYKQGNVFVSPCFYDYVLDETEMFKVNGFDVDTIFEKLDNLTAQQYKYSEKTTECADCELLTSCISKKVLSSMEQHNIVECLMPKEIIKQMTVCEVTQCSTSTSSTPKYSN